MKLFYNIYNIIGWFLLLILMFIVIGVLFIWKHITKKVYTCPHGKRSTDVWEIITGCDKCKLDYIYGVEIDKKISEKDFINRLTKYEA